MKIVIEINKQDYSYDVQFNDGEIINYKNGEVVQNYGRIENTTNHNGEKSLIIKLTSPRVI